VAQGRKSKTSVACLPGKNGEWGRKPQRAKSVGGLKDEKGTKKKKVKKKRKRKKKKEKKKKLVRKKLLPTREYQAKTRNRPATLERERKKTTVGDEKECGQRGNALSRVRAGRS